MDAIGPATSEWVVDGADRYAATPEDALPALDVPGFRAHDPDVNVAVEKGACTQVVVHKARDGSYRLLLNGCESQLGEDGYHTLPSYRMEERIREDATGREVPAPVLAAVLVEDGACAPESVTLQVKQRTFVAGMQTDEGSEPVVSEAQLRSTRPGDRRCLARAVSYPMAIGPTVKATFADRKRARQVMLDSLARYRKSLIRLLRNRVPDKKLVGRLINAAINASPWQKAGMAVAFLPALPVLAGAALLAAAGAGAAGPAAVGYAAFSSASLAAQVAWSVAKQREIEALREDQMRPQEHTISVFDLPLIIQRIAGTAGGGMYSRGGVPLSLKELRAAKRHDDAALMEWITEHAELGVDEKAEMERMLDEEYRKTLPQGHPEKDRVSAATRQQIKADVEEAAKSALVLDGRDLGNTYTIDSVDEADIVARGYVESVLCIEVVDSRRPGSRTRETFKLRSAQAFSAGFVAAGYLHLEQKLTATVADVKKMFASSLDLNHVPIVHQHMYKDARPTGDAKKDLMDFWVKRNQGTSFPPEQRVFASLNGFAQKVLETLQAVKALATLPANRPLRFPLVARYLPHVVRIRVGGAASFALGTEDANVVISEVGGVTAIANDGLRDAVGDMSNIARTVRQAVAQFVEGEGVARPRTRVQLVMAGTRIDPDAAGVSPLVEPVAKRMSTINTRHVYAPRLPLAVVDAMACREEHTQMREQLAIAWLQAPLQEPKGTGIADKFRVPASHTGELTLGVIADLATDDVLKRAPNPGLHVSPMRTHLMESAVENAVRRLSAVVPLTREVFRERPVPKRLHDSDALFVCYPEGPTLLKLLRESAAWREWQTPRTDPWKGRRSGWRQDMRAAMADAAPTSIASLVELLESIERLQAVVMPLDRFPFLAPQTLATHTPEALAMLKTHDALSPKVLNRAWAGLAMQLEHAAFAAQRLRAMATGLGVSEPHQAALLRDCVRARPVLQHVPVGADLDEAPVSCVGSLALFTQPISQLRGSGPLQPGVPDTPSAHTLLDNRLHRAVLQARTAAMRLDIADLANERALEDDAPLDEIFARLRVGSSAAQYLVSFGDAAVKGHYPLMGRFFESLPVYMGLLHADAPKTSKREASRGTIVPRTAHDCEDNLHPMVITTNGAEPSKLRLSVALVNLERSDAMSAPLPETLAEALAQLDTTEGGVDVDAASAILFNVERLVQCVLLVAATSPECESLVIPPPISVDAMRVAIPIEPQASQRLLLIRMRVNALLVLMSVSPGLEEADLKTRMGYNDDGVTENTTEALLVNIAFSEALYRWLDVAALAIMGNAAVGAFVKAYSDGLPANDASGRRKVELYKYFSDVLTHAEQQLLDKQDEHARQWSYAKASNERTDAEADEMRCWEHDAWPNVVAIANALARSLISAPPMLLAVAQPGACLVEPTPGHSLWIAVAAWRAQGLAAVPLCELAAVLACV